MNVFLDCGSNIGHGLNKIYKEMSMDKSWEIYCFEINKECIKILKQNNTDKNISFIEKAVLVDETILPMTIEYAPEYDNWTGGATNIMGDNFKKPGYIKKEYIKKSYSVSTINFSNFIKNHFSKNDFIVCKMDIEGAEYEVLNKMIKDDTLQYINIFYIEWHNKLLQKKYNEKNIMDNIVFNNIVYNEWY